MPPDAASTAFDLFLANYEYQDEGLRRAKKQGFAGRFAVAFAQGFWLGLAKGQAEGLAKGILAVLHARGLAVSDEQRDRILAARDLDQLDRWLQAALTVASAEALFPQ